MSYFYHLAPSLAPIQVEASIKEIAWRRGAYRGSTKIAVTQVKVLRSRLQGTPPIGATYLLFYLQLQ